MAKSIAHIGLNSTKGCFLKILFFIVICFFSSDLYSQTKGLDLNIPISHYEHKSWSKINTTPINRVFNFEQDSLGFLWMGTDRGLLRFDGTSVKSFNYKDYPIFKNDNIRFVKMGKNNTLWIANRRGVFYLKDNLIKEVKLNNKSITKVLSLVIDKNNKIWVSNTYGGLFTIDNFKAKEEHLFDNSDIRVMKVFSGHDNSIWVSARNGQYTSLWKMNANKQFIQKKIDSPLNSPVDGFSENKYGVLAIININGKVYKIAGENVSHIHTVKDYNDYSRAIKIDENGAIWFGGEGLHKLYKGKLDNFHQADGLGNNRVQSIFFDKDKNLWVGTFSGLDYFSKTPFKTIQLKGNKPIRTICVLEDNDQEVLVGSKDFGLLIERNNKLLKIDGLNELGATIHSLCKTNIANEYIVGSLNGLFRIQKKNGNFRVIHQYSSKIVSIAFMRANGELWFMETDDQPNNPNNKTTYVIKDGKKHQISTLDHLNVLSLFEDSNLKLWIGTMQGLYFCDVLNESCCAVNKNLFLESKYIMNIVEDAFGTVWVGTYGSGLVEIKSEKENYLDTRNNLPENQAYLHFAANKKGLWYFTRDKKNGKFQRIILDSINNQEEFITEEIYSVPGIVNVEGISGFPTFVQKSDHSYVLASSNSLLKFDPMSVVDIPPVFRMDKVLINNVEINLNDLSTIEADAINFEFHYSSLDFVRGDNQLFEYKLEGFDKKWQQAGARKVAYYSNLPAGNYSFKVRVKNYDNVYIEMQSPLLFSKKQFWYKAPFVYFIYFIVGASIIVLIFRLRLKSLKRQRKILQNKVDLRTRKLQELNESLEEIIAKRTEKITKINKELTESDERYKYALEATNEGIWDLNIVNNAIKFSPSIYTMLGYKPYEFKESRYEIYKRISNESERQERIDIHNELISKGSNNQFLDEYKIKKKDGSEIWVQIKGKVVERDKNGAPVRVVGTQIDITSEKRKTQEMLEAILKTENIERSRISRDLHDGLQQTLTIASLNFQSAKKELSKFSTIAINKFETGWEYLQKSILESRSVAHSLMPKAIIDFGVISAFESLINQINASTETTEFNFFHNFKKERIKNQEIEITLYRILQESTNNIIKYAKAKNVSIQLKDYDNMYMLTIEDDGIGFDVATTNKNGKGFGFQSMRNRLEAIDGFLEIESRIGQGTTIIIEINKII
ncbi:two-component regulator propeller domain-containing protein [Lutibacter holmesii]|uniref:histidine kinase n=1 Tax=Lutibacter holmesii TaxID=1137985 RepID=A0ABW3WJA8_9FLAO